MVSASVPSQSKMAPAKGRLSAASGSVSGVSSGIWLRNRDGVFPSANYRLPGPAAGRPGFWDRLSRVESNQPLVGRETSKQGGEQAVDSAGRRRVECERLFGVLFWTQARGGEARITMSALKLYRRVRDRLVEWGF